MSEPTPTLYLYCHDNTEYLETTYAVIEITPAWAQAMCGLVYQMASLRTASAPSHMLYQMEYWDWTPTWVTRPNTAGDEGDLIEALFDDVENNEAVYVATGMFAGSWADDESDQSVDCVTLKVQEDGIHWTAYVKHADGARLWTETIPLRDLERYARGEEPVSALVTSYEAEETEE